MMRRIEREVSPLKRSDLARRRRAFFPLEEQTNPELALAYSNGYVTVEISQDAVDAYIDLNGDVPAPVVHDAQTGDRRTYDARHQVRVVYDGSKKIREVSTRSRDGLFVRVNFTDLPQEAQAR